MNFQNWKILSTPEYHFLMLLIALLIGIVCLVILHEVRKTQAALSKTLTLIGPIEEQPNGRELSRPDPPALTKLAQPDIVSIEREA